MVKLYGMEYCNNNNMQYILRFPEEINEEKWKLYHFCVLTLSNRCCSDVMKCYPVQKPIFNSSAVGTVRLRHELHRKCL